MQSPNKAYSHTSFMLSSAHSAVSAPLREPGFFAQVQERLGPTTAPGVTGPPVTVTRQGRPSVVILSAAEYQRRQTRAWRNLLSVMEEAGEYAAEHGLTEEGLDRLLADES